MSKTTKALAALGVVAGLGVAALPLSVGALTKSDTITVRTTIEDTLTLTIVGDTDTAIDDGDEDHLVLLGANGKMTNGSAATAKATVTVATNNVGGYSVKMKGENGYLAGQSTSETIPALGSSQATFPATGDTSAFGYQTVKIGEVTTFSVTNSTWNPVKTTDEEIAKNTAATKQAGDTFNLNFQAYVNESQAADTYEETVTITASTGV